MGCLCFKDEEEKRGLLKKESTYLNNIKKKDPPKGSVIVLNVENRKEIFSKSLLKRMRRTQNDSDQRAKILIEFFETEVAYVENLKILIDFYIIPLKSYLTSEEIEQIFKNVETVYQINVKFLKELEDSLSKEDIEKEFGMLIKNFSSSFKLYTNYISNYTNAINLIQKYRKNKEISDFFKETENKLKKERMSDIYSYLILPVQRLPRYKLLLEDLFKNNSNNDYIKEAYQKIKEITLYCNSKQTEIENSYKMSSLQSKLAIQDLVQPHRSLIKFDEKLGNIKRKREKNQSKIDVISLYLFSDLLICVSKKLTIGSKLFQIPLIDDCSIICKEIDEEYGFMIHNEKYPILILYSKDYKDWIENILFIIEKGKNSIKK